MYHILEVTPLWVYWPRKSTSCQCVCVRNRSFFGVIKQEICFAVVFIMSKVLRGFVHPYMEASLWLPLVSFLRLSKWRDIMGTKKYNKGLWMFCFTFAWNKSTAFKSNMFWGWMNGMHVYFFGEHIIIIVTTNIYIYIYIYIYTYIYTSMCIYIHYLLYII